MEGFQSRSLALTVIEAGSMIVLNVLSLVGNVLVCISVYRNPRLRTSTNLYIIALAISDLLSAIFVMPLVAGVLISGRWPFGETFCQIHAFFSLFVVYVSPITMGLTAANKYVRICKTDRQYKRFFSKRKSCAVLASAWMFVACYILIPRLTGLQEFHFVPGYAACLIKHLTKFNKMLHYVVVIFLFSFVPLTVTIFSYRKVSKKIREHSKAIAGTFQAQGATLSAHEIRISRSLFVVVLAFMLCWIPTWLITILTRLVTNIPRSVQLLCAYCLNLSNTINPFIYAGMNPLFRREFSRLLHCVSYRRVGLESTEGGEASNCRNIALSSMARSENKATNAVTA